MSLSAEQIIHKKRDGQKLKKEEIDFLINGYVAGKIPDYQMAAWAMAVYFRGLSSDETAYLTMSMANSGDLLDLTKLGYILDKHSTGGVGDTTTLVVLPIVAACGGKIAKLSGRGLGHTGGTIDKLESIPGVNTELAEAQFLNQVEEIGLALAGQTQNLVPADKLLYALRDVTATVDSLPLIAASIMSKKIAGGASGIVLDVKVGRGAFMKDLASARELALQMVSLGKYVNRKVTAVISDMDVPLGLAQGNALEVQEAICVLNGQGGRRLRELSLVLAEEMLALAQIPNSAKEALESGEALKMFKKLVAFQGGDLTKFSVKAPYVREVIAEESGYLNDADALLIGELVRDLGAGRKVKGETIDPDVGIVFHHDLGDPVLKGKAIASIYARDQAAIEMAVPRLARTIKISPMPYNKPVVLEIIRSGELS